MQMVTALIATSQIRKHQPPELDFLHLINLLYSLYSPYIHQGRVTGHGAVNPSYTTGAPPALTVGRIATGEPEAEGRYTRGSRAVEMGLKRLNGRLPK